MFITMEDFRNLPREHQKSIPYIQQPPILGRYPNFDNAIALTVVEILQQRPKVSKALIAAIELYNAKRTNLSPIWVLITIYIF
jgi:hypothetical protein